MRSVARFLGGVSAIIVFAVVNFVVSSLVYVIVWYINKGELNSFLTTWFLPFFSRSMAGYTAVLAGAATLEKLYNNYPRRVIVIVVVGFWTLWFIMAFAPVPGQIYDVDLFAGLAQAIVSSITAWWWLWRRDRVISN